MISTAGPERPRVRARDYFERVHDAFHRAVVRCGLVECFWTAGPDIVRLQFAGSELTPFFFPAFAHLALAAPAASADLTICIWDTASTGVDIDPPGWSEDDYRERGQIRGYCEDGIYTAFHTEGTILSLFDERTRTAIVWTPESAGLPYYKRGAPCRSILSWWNGLRGRQLVHAGAVGWPDGCVLLAGKGGSGKSNVALGCVASGISYLADDWCAVSVSPMPTVFSIYGTAKVHATDLRRLPLFAREASNPDRLDSEKAMFFLNERFAHRLLRQAPLKALVAPRVVGRGPTRIRRITAAQGMLAFAPSTFAMLPYSGGDAIGHLAAIVRFVPCFSLEIGGDGAEATELIRELIRELIGPSGGAYG